MPSTDSNQSNSKQPRFGITGKIWLAISIILLGYLITMGQVALIGQYTKKQHNHIADHLFPAAIQAQTNLAAFETQMEHFEYAILLGEPERLQTAQEYNTTIKDGLLTLIDNPYLPDNIRGLARDILVRHKNFSKQAFALYSKMATELPTEELLSQGELLANTANRLEANFKDISELLNQEMKKNLRDINSYFSQQQTTSILIFIATVTVSIVLVSIILAKTILKPLKKTVHLANLMAAGDLSQKVDIDQQDEIGELGAAMNTMADQIERSYARMETIIAKRTRILRRTNEKLRTEVQSKHDAQQEIFTALDQAKQANEAKSTFLANMSHEIRTPMNGIIGMTSLLLETSLSPTQKSYLKTLRSSAKSLLTILNDILDFGRIESGQLELKIQEFNPLEIVAEITDLVTLRAQDMGLVFSTLIDWKIPPLLQGDKTRLRQILLNITDNAVKFTNRGEIALKIDIDKKTEESITLRCSVSDTGIGIPKEKLEHIFEPFTQVDGSTTRKYGGTGLGLAISKKLVTLMGGEIHIESTPNEGTTVWFLATFKHPKILDPFPEYSSSTELIYSTTSNTNDKPQPGIERKNILIADDEPTSQDVLTAVLQTFGASPHIVSNGQQVLDTLDTHTFDLILMDCQMPVLDGFETTRAIRKREGADSQIPIIALTADTSHLAKTKCLAAGMNDFLTKPIEPLLLKEYINKWLQPEQYVFQRPILIAELVLKRQGGDQERATQVLAHAEQITSIHLEELDIAKQKNYPAESTNKLCIEVKKLGAHLGIAKLQNQAIHLQLALKNKENKQVDAHAKSLKQSILRLSQELKQAGMNYDHFFNS